MQEKSIEQLLFEHVKSRGNQNCTLSSFISKNGTIDNIQIKAEKALHTLINEKILVEQPFNYMYGKVLKEAEFFSDVFIAGGYDKWLKIKEEESVVEEAVRTRESKLIGSSIKANNSSIRTDKSNRKTNNINIVIGGLTFMVLLYQIIQDYGFEQRIYKIEQDLQKINSNVKRIDSLIKSKDISIKKNKVVIDSLRGVKK